MRSVRTATQQHPRSHGQLEKTELLDAAWVVPSAMRTPDYRVRCSLQRLGPADIVREAILRGLLGVVVFGRCGGSTVRLEFRFGDEIVSRRKLCHDNRQIVSQLCSF